MQATQLIMARVKDDQSLNQVSLPLRCTHDEHYSGAAALKAKTMAMEMLNSKPAFTHVTLEPIADPELESLLKKSLRLNPNALMHQRIYNPMVAEFRGYAELEIEGYVIKYALRTSGFCAYAVAQWPNNKQPSHINNLNTDSQPALKAVG